jgi:hypothetical protein
MEQKAAVETLGLLILYLEVPGWMLHPDIFTVTFPLQEENSRKDGHAFSSVHQTVTMFQLKNLFD